MEFATKRKWKENGRFWRSVEFAIKMEFARKNKTEFAWKGNCKE